CHFYLFKYEQGITHPSFDTIKMASKKLREKIIVAVVVDSVADGHARYELGNMGDGLMYTLAIHGLYLLEMFFVGIRYVSIYSTHFCFNIMINKYLDLQATFGWLLWLSRRPKL
ncbi:hypothetical protein ACJX0J_016581, partial [Zea mays]